MKHPILFPLLPPNLHELTVHAPSLVAVLLQLVSVACVLSVELLIPTLSCSLCLCNERSLETDLTVTESTFVW